MSEMAKNSKFKAAEMVKMAVWDLQYDQNRFYAKSEWQ